MNRLSWILILLLPAALLAQGSFRVAGKVMDGNTGQFLQGASVFCQNTTSGTVTNADGEFGLRLNNGGYDLVVSFSGYENQVMRISNNMQDAEALMIVLQPKEKSMEEVSIVATTEVRNGWEKYGSFLKDNFIGKTGNSKDCIIENPEVLRFFFSRKKNQLKVTTDSVVVIRNTALGYIIKYRLDSFIHEYNEKKTLYTGFPFYEEMEGTDEEVSRWIKNRKIAYDGSVLQFMRSYRDSTLRKAGYKIEVIDDEGGKNIPIMNPYDTVYFDILDFARVGLFFPGKLRVVYSNEKPSKAYLTEAKLPSNTPVQISILDLADGIIIEENGYYYDQKDVLTLGYWAWEKMADFLPYDYSETEPRKQPPVIEPVAEPVEVTDTTTTIAIENMEPEEQEN